MARGRVLVVDDEADVRMSVRSTLTKAGSDVLDAGDKQQAIEAIRSCDKAPKVDVGVCDLYVPNVGGTEVIAFIPRTVPFHSDRDREGRSQSRSSHNPLQKRDREQDGETSGAGGAPGSGSQGNQGPCLQRPVRHMPKLAEERKGGLMTQNTIVVVADEHPIRDVVRLALTSAGYDVIETEDGISTIETMQTGGDADSLLAVICDLDMLRRDGAQVIEVLRARFPSLPVMVLTGKPDMPLAISLIKKGIAGYLLKPFTREMLTAAVDRAVAHLSVAYGRLFSTRAVAQACAEEAAATSMTQQHPTRIKCTWALWLRNVLANLLLPSVDLRLRCSPSQEGDHKSLHGYAVTPLNPNEIGGSD